MWRPVRVLVMVAALLAAGLGAAVSASATTTSAPTLITSNYACSNGSCEVGPGNVGIAFGSELLGTGELPTVSGCTYAMSLTSGSLPPGLQLSGPQFGEDCNNSPECPRLLFTKGGGVCRRPDHCGCLGPAWGAAATG